MKVVLDTSVYVEACRSEGARARFRTAFFPLLPATFLTSVVAYELRANALDRATPRLVDELTQPLERTGRLVAPTFADWLDAADIVASTEDRDASWRSKLPALLNDILIALCAAGSAPRSSPTTRRTSA